GEEVPMSSIHHLIGMGSDNLVEEMIGHPSEEAADAYSKHYQELMSELRAFPGAGDLLAEVHNRGAMVALATSADGEQLEAILEAINAPDGAIDHIVTKDDVEHSKPDPDVFKSALEATGLDPTRTLVLGDTVWDVKAADPLGLKVVGVLTGGISRCHLEEAGAIAVYDDVAQILRDIDRTPIGKLLQPPIGATAKSGS
ncbi:MAG TPA: HAD family hydrolase, partial [Acidimicrobiales bacterium]|nr:HAD family hydrolase [Acidimicrobiales bacterium]